jgi:SAM-dependent methyltransferase
MKRWYEELFENSAEQYDLEEYTKGTPGECDFLETEMDHDRRVRILDIGCGTGRHSIELASRGYSVLGVDLSEAQLAKARLKAAGRGVNAEYRRLDARDLQFEQEFGMVVMLCEGAFPLMETDEMNFRILLGASRALKPGGRFVFTTLNGLFPLFHSVKDFVNSAGGGQDARCVSNSFDLMTFRDRSRFIARDDSGRQLELECDERYYVPSEISWLLRSAGFDQIGIFGARLGAFSRGDGLTTEDFEMLVTARKKTD